MKNSKRIVLSLLLSFAAVPVWAISISCDKNLQFGTIIAPVSNTPSIYATVPNSSDTLSVPLSNTAPTSVTSSASYLAPQRARCTVTGTSTSKFTLSIIPSSGSQITYLPEATDITTTGEYTLSNTTGIRTIYIGGKLNIATATSGSQTPSFTVTATCANDNPTC